MPTEQISFWEASDNSVPSIENKNGRIILTTRTETKDGSEHDYANLYLDWGGKRYLLKPQYNWEELQNSPNIQPVTHEDNGLMLSSDKIVWDWFEIKKQVEEGEEEIHIYSSSDTDAAEIIDDGNPVTAAELKDKLEEYIKDGLDANPHSITVVDKPVYISKGDEIVVFDLPVGDAND